MVQVGSFPRCLVFFKRDTVTMITSCYQKEGNRPGVRVTQQEPATLGTSRWEAGVRVDPVPKLTAIPLPCASARCPASGAPQLSPPASVYYLLRPLVLGSLPPTNHVSVTGGECFDTTQISSRTMWYVHVISTSIPRS